MLAGLSDGGMTPAENWFAARDAVRAGDRFGAFVHVPEFPPADYAEMGPLNAERPLAGLPVAVKDLFDTADMPTAYGSASYAGHRPVRDAAIVAELRALGAFVLGKTATTEFATWPPTTSVNPHDPTHTPGGSSAGSAIAVAAGLAPVALGTQTLGSVIRPASYCGVVGFKPSFGRLSRAGIKPLADSLDTVGLFARSVTDVELVYRALVPGPDRAYPLTGRLGFLRGPYWGEADTDAQVAMESGVARLRAAGLVVEDVHWPELAEASKLCRRVHDYELGRNLFADWRDWGHLIHPSLREGIAHARTLPPEQHAEAMLGLEDLRRRFRALFLSYDAIICLAATGQAPRGLESTGNSIMNAGWTALHVPCLTLPTLAGRDGLPIGMQLVAHRYEEHRLFAVGALIERCLAGIGNS
ncbi:Putative amidase AmiD [Starkeya nomas]|uniref:Amidase AmiD n=2 Tax=Starkeya nomas TaxID=2666134 RepID=A0A5S9R5S8_9HYPH|nr:Putative amidase AmiD [Starkeya nomas]